MFQASRNNTLRTLQYHWRALALLTVCFMLLATAKTHFISQGTDSHSASSFSSELVLLPYSDRSISIRFEYDHNSDNDSLYELPAFSYTLLSIHYELLLPLVKPTENPLHTPLNYYPNSNNPRAPPIFS